MSEIVADCPRCGAQRITFDLLTSCVIGVRHRWQGIYEAFCVCKACRRSTVFVLSQRSVEHSELLHRGLEYLQRTANDYLIIEDFVRLRDGKPVEPPEHLPEDIEAAFKEGAACFAIGCYNAAATMFRLCLDLATKALLPENEADGLNAKTRRELGLRLAWLFAHKVLPEGLHDLSVCIKQDGNDGAHDGSLTEHDAHDILDFAYLLLERLYTEKKRIEDARARQLARRSS